MIAGDSAYWLRSKAALRPDAVIFPPLGPQVELMSSPLAGGESRVLSSIMEPAGDEVIGVSDGTVWFSAHRDSLHFATIIYRAPVAGGAAIRVTSETGQQVAVLTPTGALYWTAPSREAQNYDQIICVRRQVKSGNPETLNEWLPAAGRLFYTHHGMVYVDGELTPSAWPITTNADLPTPVRLPDGFCAIAAGDNDLLLRRKSDFGKKTAPIYRMPEP